MRAKWIIFGLFVLFMCLAGEFFFARRVKTLTELYGTYFADYEFANEELILHGDGSFTQRVTLKTNGKVDIAEGVWRYDSSDGYISFDGYCMNVMDGFQKLNPDYAVKKYGHGVLPADKFFGKIQIGGGGGVLYTKTK